MPMSDEHDEETVEITLELAASLAADLEEIRREFGEELLTDLVIKAHKSIEGRLALRGVPNRGRK
jgi:hypothetical protein